MKRFPRICFGLCLMMGFALAMSGCRRNLMQITTTPPGVNIYVQGELVRLEHSNKNLARKIDEKKKREKPLNEEEEAFQKDRKRLQLSPVEYEFDSIACGYSIYCVKKGYEPVYHEEYIKPRWYEFPPIDLIVDCLPFTITDTREINIDLSGAKTSASAPTAPPETDPAPDSP